MKNFLAEVIQSKRQEITELRCHDRKRESHKSFKVTLNKAQIGIIAEVKRASPAVGRIAAISDPSLLVQSYISGGADAVSVLTEKNYFNGSPEDLQIVSQVLKHTELPVLQKDFILEKSQIDFAVTLGADAVLLIVMAVGSSLKSLIDYCREKNIEAIVEVTDPHEISQALEAGAEIILINNRDLRTLEMTPLRAKSLIQEIPNGICTIAASGIRTADEVRELESLGFNGVLIGEALSGHEDPAGLLRSFKSISTLTRPTGTLSRQRARGS